MEKSLVFDEDVNNYDKWRPKYCEELYKEIIKYADLNNKKKVIEVGSGTGQATETILNSGCILTAVEYGVNFASFLKKKFYSYSNFRVVNQKFEDFIIDSNSVDLLFSASAFHWIPSEIGYVKAYDLLREGGVIALFWNRPFVNKYDDPLHQEIQRVYCQFGCLKNNKPPVDIEYDIQRYNEITNEIHKNGFADFKYHIYKSKRVFNADEYVALLNTYSDHRLMDTSTKVAFENEIREVIIKFGEIIVYDTMDLFLARKPFR